MTFVEKTLRSQGYNLLAVSTLKSWTKLDLIERIRQLELNWGNEIIACKRGINHAEDFWHYPSKGEYPPEGEEVLIRIDNKNYLGYYDGEIMWHIPLAEITCSGDWVDMWQYIVLPKDVK